MRDAALLHLDLHALRLLVHHCDTAQLAFFVGEIDRRGLTSRAMEVEPSLTLRASAGRALSAPMTSRALPMYSFKPGWRTHTGRSQTPAALPAKAPPPRDDEGRSLTVRRVSS